jgi:hypothetical protein
MYILVCAGTLVKIIPSAGPGPDITPPLRLPPSQPSEPPTILCTSADPYLQQSYHKHCFGRLIKTFKNS